MKVLDIPTSGNKDIIINSDADIEDLGFGLVDDFFQKCRNEFEEKEGISYTDYSFKLITSSLYYTINDEVITITQENFPNEKGEYVLSLINQQVFKFKGRVMNALDKGIQKDNVLNLFGN